ncbi:putative amidase AmiA2 domain protein [Mycobacterium xenopi 3993]|nr:putative amidase AmiA2 domain protein [Mycobacterium xenopi 3993]
MSTLFPFTGFRATLHPEIKAALDSVAEQLRLLGHTVMTGNPITACGCR